MKNKIVALFCTLQFISGQISAQTEEYSQSINNKEYVFEKDYWVPALLESTPNGLYYLSTYGGNLLNWIPRGIKQRPATIINGINWASSLEGGNAITSNLYLNAQFKQQSVTQNFEFDYNGFGLFSGQRYLNSAPINSRRLIQVGSGYQSQGAFQDIALLFSSGKVKKHWYFSFLVASQNSPSSYVANGFKKLNETSFTIERVFKYDQKFILLFWWNVLEQSRKSPYVREVYDLARDRNYSPNWGWKNGQPIYPSARYNNIPVLQFSYSKKWISNKEMQFHFGFAKGKQAKSGLDWSYAADPRPDYYKYLPSYSQDNDLSNSLKDWIKLNPSLLQINFDQINNVNNQSVNKQSRYIISNNNLDLNFAKSAFVFQLPISDHWHWVMGGDLNIEKGNYTNSVSNLLGGSFFYNYNSWVDESGGESIFQYDIKNPDKKVTTNGLWGPFYSIHNLTVSASTQLKFQQKRFDYTLGVLFGKSRMIREGFNRNGQFPESSFGKSNPLSFPFQTMTSSFTYKYNGRMYFKTTLFSSWEIPNVDKVYLNTELTALQSFFNLPVVHSGVDFAFIYRGVPEKFQFNVFFQESKGISGHRLFYHDGFNGFTYGQYGQMNTLKQGMEFVFETNLFSFFQLNATSTLGSYRITNNPLYEILLATDLFKVESGLLHLRGLSASNSPEWVNAFSVSCQPFNNFQFSFTSIYAMNRSEEFDFFRRSFVVEKGMKKNGFENGIPIPSLLPNTFLMNLFASSVYVYKVKEKQVQARVTFSARNLLNTLIPVIAYEQSRFDYKTYQNEKFPSKYLFDPGLVFSIGLKVQVL